MIEGRGSILRVLSLDHVLFPLSPSLIDMKS